MATAPTGFEVSADGTTYGNTATFTQTSGSASGTLRIRLKANATVSGSYNSQNIVLSSTGATSVNITTASTGNVVSKATPSLSITSANSATAGGSVSLTASSSAASGAVSSSTGAITYSSSDTGVVSIIGTTANAVAAGSATITANQAADANYNAATATQSFTVNAPAGSITPSTSSISALTTTPFGTPSGAASFTVSASGLTANLSVTPPSGFEVSTSEGSGYATSLTLTPTGGNVDSTTVYVRLAATTVPGNYSGNITLSGAGASSQLISVASSSVIKADQTIAFGALASKTVGDPAFTLNATASSSLTVSYTSSDPLVATVSGNTVTIVGAGTTTITASQAGNTNYNSAISVNQTLTVNKASQTITFGVLTERTTAEAPFTVTATASSTLPVTFSSSNLGVATVTGSTVTITGPGTTTITASQAGNANFDAAPNVNQTLTVTAAAPLIAAWDFQTTSNGGTAAAAPTATPVVYVANFGSGTIYLDGSNGSSSWLVATSNTQLSAFSGASVNASSVVGMTTTTTSPASLGVVGGASNVANGKRVSFKFSMLGRKDLVVSYASQGTGSGFTSQLWEYSTDGSTWTALQTVSGIPTSFAVFTLNTITALDGDPEVYLRATFNGATASSGNNRLDNIQLRATTVPTIQTSGSLSAVNSTYGVPSSATSFSLSGIFMSEGVTVTPPSGFEVSTDSNFSSNVGTAASPLVVGAAGTISSTTVFVRLAASTAAGSYSGNIQLTSTGATGVNVVTVSSTVSKATPTITAAPTAAAITFGQSLASSSLSGGTGSVPGSFAFTSTSATPSGAGSYSAGVTFTPTDTTNYNTATGTTTVTVNKATPTVGTAPTATLKYGQTLSSAVFSGGSATGVGGASLAGIYTLNNPASYPSGIGTSSYAATFTPSDTTNYNTAATSVSVTVGYATVDGGTVTQNFNSATPTAETRVTSFPGWTSNNGQGADGFVTVNNDPANVAAYIGQFISDVPNPELVYQFDRGGSEKIVFIWEQQITESSVDFPGVDSFGWAFRDGSTTLFSLRFLPEKVSASDPGYDWDENGAISPENKLVAVAFDGNSSPSGLSGLGPLDQVNFSTFERGQTVKFRVIIDLEAKSYSIDVDNAGAWYGLVFESALPAGTTNVDRMVALWDMRDKTLSVTNKYESGGDNLMLFDNLAITGSDLGRTPVTLTLTSPTAPITYDGLAKAATATANPNVAYEITYWDTTSTASTTNAPVNAGTYTAKVTVVDEVTYAATPQYVTYTIGKATPLITWNNPAPIAYGTALSGAELNASSSVDGSFVYSPTNGAILNAGTNTLTAVFTASNTITNNYVSPLTNTVSLVVLKASQIISMTELGSMKTFGDSAFNLGATSTGPGTLSYSSSNTNVATVSSIGQVTIVGAGSATLTVSQAGTGNYEAATPVDYSLLVKPATPTVTFVASNITYGQTLAASSLSGSSATGVGGASVGGTFTFDTPSFAPNVGTITNVPVTFTPSSGNYETVLGTVSVTVDPAALSLSLVEPSTGLTYDGNAKIFTYTPAEAIVNLTYVGRSPTVYSSSNVAPTEAGDYTVTASSGDSNFTGSVSRNFTIAKANQTISQVDATVGKTFGDAPYFAGGLTSSGLIPAYSSSNIGVATVDEFGQVTIVGAGTTTITVSQAGNNNYNAATSVTQALTVAKAMPLIAWIDPAPIMYGTALSGSELNAISSVDGSFSYNPASGAVLNAGTNTLTAVFTAANTNNYVSPLTNTVSLVVYKAFQTISMTELSSMKTFGDSAFNLGATSTGPGTLSYSSSDTGVATVNSSGQVTIVGAGSATLTVSQAGTGNYEAATSVDYSLLVNKATPTVTFVASNITYGQTLADSSLSGSSATGVGGVSVGGTFTFDSPGYAPIGTESVPVTFTPASPDSDNYEVVFGTVLVTVDPVTLTLTLVAPNNLTYDGNPKSYTYTPAEAMVELTYVGRSPTIYPSSNLAPTDAGDYTVTATSTDPNITGSVSEDFTIAKANQTITGVASSSSATFGDAPYSLFAVADSMLIPSFSSSNTGVATVDNSGQVTIVGAGTTTITVSQAGNNNYNAASSVTQTLTVAKATPTIVTAPTASAITSGQALSSSNLTGGSATGVTGANLAGSFAFTSPSTVPAVGTASQSVTFTPTDTTNYNNATTTVSVTVNSADGPWDVWADSFGLANGTARTHSADPDGDGFVNALEFAFGTSPVARNAEVFVSHTKVGSNYVVTFKKRKVASEVTYDIRQSTDLKQTFGSGTTMTQGSVTSVDANYDQTTVTLPISGNRGFVRMQATVNVTPSR